jgi:hypothetical protein
MANGFRFGRRVKLPSTVEIKHELRMMTLADSIDALQREAAAHRLETSTPLDSASSRG